MTESPSEFHGVIKPKTNRLTHAIATLVAHLSRRREPVQTPSFAGVYVSAINCFLHVAARFFQNLPISRVMSAVNCSLLLIRISPRRNNNQRV